MTSSIRKVLDAITRMQALGVERDRLLPLAVFKLSCALCTGVDSGEGVERLLYEAIACVHMRIEAK